jgi:hypothetical protein
MWYRRKYQAIENEMYRAPHNVVEFNPVKRSPSAKMARAPNAFLGLCFRHHRFCGGLRPSNRCVSPPGLASMHDRCVRGAVVSSYLLKPFIGTPQDTIIAEASHEDILGGGIVLHAGHRLRLLELQLGLLPGHLFNGELGCGG